MRWDPMGHQFSTKKAPQNTGTWPDDPGSDWLVGYSLWMNSETPQNCCFQEETQETDFLDVSQPWGNSGAGDACHVFQA